MIAALSTSSTEVFVESNSLWDGLFTFDWHEEKTHPMQKATIAKYDNDIFILVIFIYIKLTYYCLSNTNVPNDFDSSVSVCACESNFSFCLPNTSYIIVTFLPERSQVKTEGLPP